MGVGNVGVAESLIVGDSNVGAGNVGVAEEHDATAIMMRIVVARNIRIIGSTCILCQAEGFNFDNRASSCSVSCVSSKANTNT